MLAGMLENARCIAQKEEVLCALIWTLKAPHDLCLGEFTT